MAFVERINKQTQILPYNQSVMVSALQKGRFRDASGKFISFPASPTYKQLWKWASLWCKHKGMDTEVQLAALRRVHAECISLTSFMKQSIPALEKVCINLRREQSKIVLNSYNKVLYEPVDLLETLHRRIRDVQEETLLRVKDSKFSDFSCEPSAIFHDLIGLCKHFNVLYDPVTNELLIYTTPCIISDIKIKNLRYDFGVFKMIISPEISAIKGIGSTALKIVPTTPRYPRGRSTLDVVHPHVMNNSLCFGSGETAAKVALKQGRILDVVSLADSVLHNYGATAGYAPYVDLVKWQGVCDFRVHPKTGERIPHDAVLPVDEDERAVCPCCMDSSVLEMCEYEGCFRRVCSSCITACNCGRAYCDAHALTCSNCEDYICMHCTDSEAYEEGYCTSCWEEIQESEEEEDDD